MVEPTKNRDYYIGVVYAAIDNELATTNLLTPHQKRFVSSAFYRQMRLESMSFDWDVIIGDTLGGDGEKYIPQVILEFHPDCPDDPEASIVWAAQYMLRNVLANMGYGIREAYAKACVVYNAGSYTMFLAYINYSSMWILGIPNTTREYIKRVIYGG